MNMRVKILLRAIATLVATAIAFCAGFLGGTLVFNQWYFPRLAKQYPHDGQIGLGGVVLGFYGAWAFAAIVLVLGTIWTVNAARRSRISGESHDRKNVGTSGDPS